MPVDLLDSELLDERACILAQALPWEESVALAHFWHTWTPDRLAVAPSTGVVLRRYQVEAVDAAYAAWEAGESVVLSLPTGAGKSLVLAELCKRIPGRILIVTHKQELLVQNSQELAALMGDGADYGLYCAGLKAREADARVVFASIASVYRRVDRLTKAGPFAAILCDEFHRVGWRQDTSMYRTLLDALPGVPLIGVTATPSRMSTPIYGHPDAWASRLASHVSMADLTPEYLAPLVGVLGASDIDVSQVHTHAGDYNKKELAQVSSEEAVVEAMADEVCMLAQHRQSWLVFCVDKAHVGVVAAAFVARGIQAAGLTDDTPSDQRAALFADMKSGALRCLVNCEIATTGSNIPRIDCIVLLRPTQSKELVIQMIGRGTRQFHGKSDALLLDYSGAIQRHAPLDGLPTFTESPERTARREAREAEEAARQEAERQAKHARTVFGAESVRTYQVRHVTYERVVKKATGTPMLLVKYLCEGREAGEWLPQWICIEHQGYALRKARLWLARRSDEQITSVQQALLASKAWGKPHTIRVEEAAFPEITEEIWS